MKYKCGDVSKHNFDTSPHDFLQKVRRLFACDVFGNTQGVAAFGATCGQHLTAILCSHSQTEAVLVDSATVRGLESPFHFVFCVLFYV